MYTNNSSKKDNKNIEKENLNNKSDNEIKTPFDPTLIDIDMATINLGSLIDQIANDEIDIQPDFQRASDLWNSKQKSRLIESILLGLPIPSFYFSEDPVTKKLSVIDGLQRICALKDFILKKDNSLILSDLQFLLDFKGKKYSDLGRSEIRRIQALKISINILRKNTPLEVKYVIFQRVNTAGMPLTPQEMRHALNQGTAAKFIKSLAEQPAFLQATSNVIRSRRMEDRDFTNRFVAFFIGYKDYSGDLDSFLNDKMGELNKISQNELDKIEAAFIKSMECCYQIFKEDAFRRRYDLLHNRKPISKAIFDTLSVNIAWLNNEERAALEKNAISFKNELTNLFNEPKFDKATLSGTGQKANVDYRFEQVKNAIKEVIHNAF